MLSVRPTTAFHPPGGILGDEMGLGKTVEVLGCMLHHTRQGITLPHPLPVIQGKTVNDYYFCTQLSYVLLTVPLCIIAEGVLQG